MKSRPTIGITVDSTEKETAYESPFAYATAVEKAGGLPILLPYRADLALVSRYADLIDGMLFSGGHDLDPSAWGEAYHPKTNRVDPAREKFERALMAEVERRRTPTLGICLGSQLMNVYRGGSMIQFLPDFQRADALEHRKGDREPWNCHPVNIDAESTLARAVGQRQIITCNTSHKQAMKNIGRGLRVVAKAPDGIVEAVEDPSMPLWLGVQWHPERMHDQPEHFALFKLLVERAAEKPTR
jgi:putative glutamine amidotransferase